MVMRTVIVVRMKYNSNNKKIYYLLSSRGGDALCIRDPGNAFAWPEAEETQATRITSVTIFSVTIISTTIMTIIIIMTTIIIKVITTTYYC